MKYEQANWLLDVAMPSVKGNAFKVIAAVARKTWGWGKEREQISLSEFQELIGVASKQTAANAVDEALASGFIARAEKGNSFEYWAVMKPASGTDVVPENGTESVPATKEGQAERYRNQGANGTESVPMNGTESVPSQSGITKEPKNKESKKRLQKQDGCDSRFAEAIAAYQDNISMTYGPMIADDIGEAVDKYPDGWVVDAIEIAAKANKRSWNYIAGILRNWESKGFQDTKPGPQTQTSLPNAMRGIQGI